MHLYATLSCNVLLFCRDIFMMSISLIIPLLMMMMMMMTADIIISEEMMKAVSHRSHVHPHSVTTVSISVFFFFFFKAKSANNAHSHSAAHLNEISVKYESVTAKALNTSDHVMFQFFFFNLQK